MFGLKRIERGTYLVVLFFLILSIFLILAWFKDGHFYAGGDVGLPTYNPMRIFGIARYIWWEAIAPGFLIPHVITSISLYFFLSFLQFFGLGPVGIQAILFFVLLFLMGFGMYLLTISMIGKDKKIYALLAGLFYIFNPYMMLQIWHRFTHTSMFFVAALPFLVLFWKLWIKKGNSLFLLLFLLTNLIASYMFGTLAYVFPFWLLMFLLAIAEIFLPWENKTHFIEVLGRVILGLVIWVLFNSWWLIPVLTVSQGVASQQHSIWESIATLISISKQAILPYSLQMVNSFYLFAQAELGDIYKSFFFRLIPWIGVITIFYGIFFALRKNHLAAYVLIYFVIILLAKGTSEPFGQPFLLLFSKFFVFGLLRNPFEKIGILLPLISSILFVVGVEGFFSRFGKNLGTKLILVVLLVVIGIFYFPMYQGTILGKIGQPNYVDVPQSYKEADRWLNQKVHQDSIVDGKILHLPLTRSDIATYKWKYGYHGIESSATIFSSLPSLSHGLNISRIDDALTALSLIFYKPFNLHQDKILKIVQDFNVRFIILHKDLDWLGGDTYSPFETEKVLNSLKFINKEAEFGDLVIFKIKDEFFSPKIELKNNISLVYPQKAGIRSWPWLVSKDNISFLSPSKEDLDDNLKSQVFETIIFPENSFSYPEASASSLEETKRQLINQLNIIIGAKEYVKQVGIIHDETEETVQKIILASQKLIEAYQTTQGLDEYSSLLNDIFPHLDYNSTLYFDVAKPTIADLLKLHEVTLSAIENKLLEQEKVKISKIHSKIKQFLANEKSFPLFPFQGKVTEVGQRQVYSFLVNSDGAYELQFTNSEIKNAYVNKLATIDFQINGSLVPLSGKEVDNIISFGKIDLKQGSNEISFSNPPSINLISSLDNLVKIGNVKIQDGILEMTVSTNNPAAIESPVLLTSGEDVFQISFDGRIPMNVGLYVQVIQDIDSEQNGQKVSRISYLQHLSQSDWQGSYNIKLPAVSLPTREAKVRLIAMIPPEIHNLSTSLVSINNLRLIRVLNNKIFLEGKIEKEPPNLISGQISKMKQKNPVFYEGKVKIEQPTFLIFKEAFHPGWELELKKDNKLYKVDDHYLANLYGNAWWIEKTGEYDLRIEFKPQRKVTLGIYLALTGLLVVFILMFISKYKQKYGHS